MALAFLFSLVVLSAGFAVLRTLGVATGALRLGLAPAAGLALLSTVATWCTDLNAPPPVAGVLVMSLAAVGLGLLIVDRQSLQLAAGAMRGEHRLASVTLAAAVVFTALSSGIAFGGSPVPLSPHDGAYHAQVIEAHRAGQAWVDWYPQGTAALFAAMLELMPWLDTARGATELGLALPLLAGIALFGLAAAIWHDLRVASTAALLLSFTYVYPYFPQLWSGWPLALALILVMGLWATGLEYCADASWRWAVLGGLVLGSILLVHGTELITTVLILLVVLASVHRRMAWPRLMRHLAVAGVVAVVCAAPYLPTLFHWVGTGGAYAVGLEDGQVPQGSVAVSASDAPSLFVVFGLEALGIDFPIRVLLLVTGVVWAFRTHTGRAVLFVGLLFASITSTFSLASGVPLVHQLYAATFPWGMHYRMFMLVAMAQALLAGAGAVEAMRLIGRWTRGPTVLARRLRRLRSLLVLTWVGLLAVGTTVFLVYPAGLVLGYTSEDGAAMAWLRQHASRGEVLVNDGFADAGIWAPYKTGLQVLLPRVPPQSGDLPQRALVLANVAHLDQAPGAAAAACALGVAYVYHGAHASEWDARQFPPLPELRGSPALEEVFASGEAVVFRARLPCAALTPRPAA